MKAHYSLFEFPDGKTNYQILNEEGEKTTITIEKWAADVLQIELHNVHQRIQDAYDKILKEKPNLTRREKGNLIRQMALNTANNHQETKKKVLGWNDSDVLDAL